MRWLVIILSSSIFLSSCKDNEKQVTGYIEGEYIYVSPTTSGNLLKRYVNRGDKVKIGDILFAIDTTNLEASLIQAKSEVEQATSNYMNLTKGKRPEEIKVILEQKAQVEANLITAKKDYERYLKLSKADIISQAALDEKTSAYKALQANFEELEAQLKVAMLGAREDEVNSAQKTIDIAKQKVVQIEKNIKDAAPISVVNGVVEDTFYNVGEFIGAGNSAVSILPPENIKVRFFISQKQLANIKLGQNIKINCDGCSNSIDGKITFISPKAEFTPPIIYSVESREKLVFMIEAHPNILNHNLHPGLPVNIILE